MPKKQPLSVRIYFERHLTELVRLVGYDTLTLDEARARLAPLVERYGKDVTNRAAREVLEKEAGCVRLSPAVRQAAWQLLGPPPANVAPASEPDPAADDLPVQ